MTPEQKVTSLKLSRRLKEAGAVQESGLWWSPNKNLTPYRHRESVSALDCAELLERLRDTIPKVTPIICSDGWQAWCAEMDSPVFNADTSAEALGLLYLWCLENGLIS